MKQPKVKEPLSAEALEMITPAALIGIILEQQQLIAAMSAGVSRLKEQLGTDSKTSSKPPSSDLLKKSEKEKIPPSSASAGAGCKPGGQAGHAGKTRKGFGRVDRYEVLRPEQCPKCGGHSFEILPVSQSEHCVARLVAQPIEIVQYEQQQCQCACGAVVSAEWPSDVIATQDLSVGLQSLTVWLGNYGHLSYGKQQEFLRELGDIEIGVGTLQATNRRVADAIIEPADQLWRWARSQAHIQVDETPWTVMGLKEWLWVAGAESFCLFHAAGTRSRDELKSMLGDSFDGVLSSDDFSVYNGYEVTAQQKCLAHLRRHFKQIKRLDTGDNQTMATAFVKLIDEAFRHHRQWREQLDAKRYARWAETFKIRLAATLQK
jgi:transposase